MIEPTEYPALLDVGFYQVSLAEVRQLCVESFSVSQSRGLIYGELAATVAHLNRAAIVGDLWIAGSFLTSKPEPADVDLLLHLKRVKGTSFTPAQDEILRWFTQEGRNGWCDTNIFIEQIVPDHAPRTRRDRIDEWNRAHWLQLFGFSRKREVKGIAVVTLPLRQEETNGRSLGA